MYNEKYILQEGDIVLSKMDKNLATISNIRNLKENWNGYGAKVFSGELCDFLEKIIKELDEKIQPKVFPTGRGSIQIECERNNGEYLEIDPDLIVPDTKKSLAEGAIYPWAKTANPYYSDVLKSVCEYYEIDFEKPFKALTPREKGIILYGNGDEKIKMRYRDFGTKRYSTHIHAFLGVIPYMMKRYQSSDSDLIRGEIEKYMSHIPCKVCGGARLNEFALNVKILDKNIYDFCKMSIIDELEFVNKLYLEFSEP